MLPGEYLQRVTHRWHSVLAEWVADEINHPDRADYYAMQTARQVRRLVALVAQNSTASAESWDGIIKFVTEAEKKQEEEALNRPVTKEELREAAKHARAMMAGRLGLKEVPNG